MRKNALRQRIQNRQGVLNGWLSMPGSVSAEVMAHQGWDSLTIDMQHGLIGYPDLVQMLTAISTTDTVPLVRVPSLEPGLIMKALDAGAYGLIAPLINNADEARALVAASRYPPLGRRSYGPHRAMLYGGADYAQCANDEILVLGMIETREGVSNLAQILEVDGLDGVYIGPADLMLSYGVPVQTDPPPAELETVIRDIISACYAAGRIVCAHTGSAARARDMLAFGCHMVTISSDMTLMAQGARDMLKAMGRQQQKYRGY